MEAPHLNALQESYADRGVQALIVDVAEQLPVAQGWTRGHDFAFPVGWDETGASAALFAPEGVLPDLPRFQIPIGGNLLIDRAGVIRFYSLLDTKNFDARLIALRSVLDSLLALEGESPKAMIRPSRVTIGEEGTVPRTTVRVGQPTMISIPITVEKGYHVQANPAGMEFLIPAKLEFDESDQMDVGVVNYPQGDTLRLTGSDTDLFVYSGRFEITVPVTVSDGTEGGDLALRGWFHFQSCDERTCFQPDSISIAVPLLIEHK